jgi:hypothetical protein
VSKSFHVINTAQSVAGRTTPQATLYFTSELPDVADAKPLMDADAQTIVRTLLDCLPGGTVDRVAHLLLGHQIGELRVSKP